MGTPPKKRQRVIALMNQKGGVGKTTTTVNLAAALAELGRTALVVDLDPQAHATLHLGVDPGELTGSVYDLLLDPPGDHSTLVRQIRPGLGLLPSETDLAAIDTELADQPDRQTRLTRGLAALGTDHEFVLLDCPPSLGVLTINALVAASEVVIPMQAHFLALQGLGKLLETVGLVASRANASLRVTGVVLCAFDTQTTHSQEVVADLEQFLEAQRGLACPWASARICQPPIRRNIKLAECPSFGQSIFEYAPWAPGAVDYLKLAEGLLAQWDHPQAEGEADRPATTTRPSQVERLDPGEQTEPPVVHVVSTESAPVRSADGDAGTSASSSEAIT